MAVQLKTHQVNVVKRFQNVNLIISHSTGSGKSFSAIAAGQDWLGKCPANKTRKIIVLTPKSLIENFRQQIRLFGASVKDFVSLSFEEAIKKFSGEYYRRDLSKSTDNDVLKVDDKTITALKADELMLIVDEAHNFRNHLTARAIFIRNLSLYFAKVLLLSATPAPNKIGDFCNLFAVICGQKKVINPIVLEDALSDEVNSKIIKKFFRSCVDMYKTDMVDYPTSNKTIVVLPMNADQYKRYRILETSQNETDWTNVDEDQANFSNSFYIGLRLHMNKIKSEQDPLVTMKSTWIIQKLKSYQNLPQTVIFSHFKTSGLNLLKTHLDQMKVKYRTIDGDVLSSALRQQYVDEYNLGEIQVLLISQAGGLGLDLKKTRVQIVVESGWFDLQQVYGRSVRFKSHIDLPPNERHVDIYLLVVDKPATNRDIDDKRPSVDRFLLEYSNKKEDTIQNFYTQIFDNAIPNNTDYEKDQAGVLDLYQKLLKIKPLNIVSKSKKFTKKYLLQTWTPDFEKNPIELWMRQLQPWQLQEIAKQFGPFGFEYINAVDFISKMKRYNNNKDVFHVWNQFQTYQHWYLNSEAYSYHKWYFDLRNHEINVQVQKTLEWLFAEQAYFSVWNKQYFVKSKTHVTCVKNVLKAFAKAINSPLIEFKYDTGLRSWITSTFHVVCDVKDLIQKHANLMKPKQELELFAVCPGQFDKQLPNCVFEKWLTRQELKNINEDFETTSVMLVSHSSQYLQMKLTPLINNKNNLTGWYRFETIKTKDINQPQNSDNQKKFISNRSLFNFPWQIYKPAAEDEE